MSQNKILGENVLDQFPTDQNFYLHMVPKGSNQNPGHWETMEFGNDFLFTSPSLRGMLLQKASPRDFQIVVS